MTVVILFCNIKNRIIDWMPYVVVLYLSIQKNEVKLCGV